MYKYMNKRRVNAQQESYEIKRKTSELVQLFLKAPKMWHQKH